MTSTLPRDRLQDTPVDSFGKAQGLPSSQVHDIAFGRDGLVWFATPAGLACFDGTATSVYAKNDGLSSHGLRAVAQHSTGLWVGGDAGLDHRGPTDPQFVQSAAPLPKGTVVDKLVSSEHRLWVVGPGTILSLEREVWHHHPPPPTGLDHVFDIESDTNGNAWVAGGNDGLWQRVGVDWRRHWVDGLSDARCLALGPDGEVVVGGTEGAWLFDAQQSTWRQLYDRSVVALAVTARGELFVASSGHLRYGKLHRNQGWTLVESSNGWLIKKLRSDALQNVWVCTENHGIKRISRLRHVIQRLDGAPSRGTFCVLRGPDDGLTLGTEIGATRIAGGEPEAAVPTHVKALAGRQVWDFRSSAGRTFAATNEGVLELDASGVRRVGGSLMVHAPARCAARLGTDWYFGSIAGLARLPDGAAQTQAVSPDPVTPRPLGYVYALEVDAERLWISTLGAGLWTVRAGETPEAVAAPHLEPGGNTYCVALHRGAVWVAQDDRIVCLEHDTSRLVWRSPDPVAAWTLAFDDEGRLWLGTSRGLVELDPRDGVVLRTVATWPGESHWEFTTARALSLHGNVAVCGLARAALVVDLAELDQLPPPPPPRLRRARFDNASAKQQPNSARVEEGRWRVSFELGCPWPVDETQLLFRHRLRGFSDAWTELEASSTVTYTGLRPGHYQLEAQAFAPLAGWSPTTQIYELSVVPAAKKSDASPGDRLLAAAEFKISQIEDQLDRAGRALYATEVAVLEIEVESGPQDPQPRLHYASPNAQDLLHVSAEAAKEDLAVWFGSADFDPLDWVRRLLEGEAPGPLVFETLRGDGVRRRLEIRGAVHGLPGAAAARRIEALIYPIEARFALDAAKDDFISTVTHELRTPLTSIQGALGLLTSGKFGVLPAQSAGLLDLAERNARRLARLVDDILDVQRIESGRLDMNITPTELGPVLREAVDACSHYGAQREIKLSMSGVDQPVSAAVDAHRLVQVLSNLISNAVKFSHDGGEVQCELSSDGARATLCVRDHGVGVPEDFRPHLFERFARAGQHGAVPGSGLGLPIAKAIVERLGGQIEFESVMGEGTAFFVHLPLALG